MQVFTLDILRTKNFLFTACLPQTVTKPATCNLLSRSTHTHVSRVLRQQRHWTWIHNRTEDNTMLNKVVVFVICGPKCIFNGSKHCN